MGKLRRSALTLEPGGCLLTPSVRTFIKNGNFVNVQYLGDSPDEVEANKEALFNFATGLYDDL